MLALCSENTSCFGEAFNIGAGGRFSILEMFNIIKKELDLDMQPILGNLRAGDIPHSNASVEKAVERLGYYPEISFEEGIIKTIKFY